MLSVGMSRVLKEILLSRGEVFYLDVLTLFFTSKCVPHSHTFCDFHCALQFHEAHEPHIFHWTVWLPQV